MARVWKPLPKEFPPDGATVWVTPSNQYNPPFLATFELSTFQFTDVTSSAVMPWWAVARWKPVAAAGISDSFAGTGVLELHTSNQGFPWVDMSGSLSLDGSGLTTDLAGIGEYFLDDPSFGVVNPQQVNLLMNLPGIPSPTDEPMDFWLMACGDPTSSDFTNTMQLNLIYRSVGMWSWEADQADPSNNFDFATGTLLGPPGVISVNPTTQEFLIDGVVIAGPLAFPCVFGATARIVLKMSFVTGVNAHATSLSAPV